MQRQCVLASSMVHNSDAMAASAVRAISVLDVIRVCSSALKTKQSVACGRPEPRSHEGRRHDALSKLEWRSIGFIRSSPDLRTVQEMRWLLQLSRSGGSVRAGQTSIRFGKLPSPYASRNPTSAYTRRATPPARSNGVDWRW